MTTVRCKAEESYRSSGVETYLTGPIHLKSHVLLQVLAPTVLKNTTDHSRYQPAFIGYPYEFSNDPTKTGVGPTLTGQPEAMISAEGITDSGIIGDGTIDGSGADPTTATADNPNGYSWWKLAANAKNQTSYPEFPDIPSSNGLPRPWLVEFYNSSRIIVQGILLTNSPMWNLALRYDTDVVVAGLRVFNNANDPTGAPNTDGIDPVSSKNVFITSAAIDTGDDNVAMKSGLPGIDPANPGYPTFAYYKPPYSLPQLPLQNVVIANLIFRRGHGASVGSEGVNGVNHIRIKNVQFLGTDNGFRIKSGRDRGNELSDMIVRNLQMTDVPTPISISAYYPTVPGPTAGDIAQPQVPASEPHIHDITISNVSVTNPMTVRNVTVGNPLIIGLPEAQVYDIHLNEISISTAATSGGYMRLRNLDHLTCRNVSITPLSSGAPNNGHTFDNEGGLTNIDGCDVSPTPTM